MDESNKNFRIARRLEENYDGKDFPHQNGCSALYAHNIESLVETGWTVRKGELARRIGSAGNVTEAAVHFELLLGGKPTDPKELLPL